MQFRNLPSVDTVLADKDVAAAAKSFDRDWVVDLVREELDAAREQIRQGAAAPDASFLAPGAPSLSLLCPLSGGPPMAAAGNQRTHGGHFENRQNPLENCALAKCPLVAPGVL